MNTIFSALTDPEPVPLECFLMPRTVPRQGRRGTGRAFYPCLGAVLGIGCMKREQAGKSLFLPKYNFLALGRCSVSVGPLQLMQNKFNALLNLVNCFKDAAFELPAQFLEKPLDGIEFRISRSTTATVNEEWHCVSYNDFLGPSLVFSSPARSVQHMLE